MNVSFLIAPHSTVVRSLLRLLQYRTTPWTGGVFLVCLGLLEGNQGRPPPHFTSVGFRTEKEKSFLLLRIPADLKGDRRRAVEERADLLRTGGRALQGRAASERERERERLLGVGFGNDDAPGQVSPFHRPHFFFWVLVGSGATTTTTTPPPSSPLLVSSWEFTRR